MKGRKLKISEIIEKSYKCEPIYIKSNQSDREILVDISPKSLIDLIKDIEDDGEAYEYIDESKLDSIELKCKIEQFAKQHNEYKTSFDDTEGFKWVIGYNFVSNNLYCWEVEMQNSVFGAIYFSSESIAEKCIETFEEELSKYFIKQRKVGE